MRSGVMISSTFLDLPVHRQKVIDACNRLGLSVKAMEYSTAANKSTLAASIKMVEEAKVYLAVIGHRYGEIPPNQKESITALEFRRARQLDLPCLVFFMSAEHMLTIHQIDTGEKAALLTALKQEIRDTGLLRAEFSNPDELKSLVLQSLIEFRKEVETSDDTVLDQPMPPEPWAVHPYTLMETDTLIGRASELALLDDWINRKRAAICVLHAVGGMGKSALSWHWFKDRAKLNAPHLNGLFWWSFYEANATFSDFITTLLAYVKRKTKEAIEEQEMGECFQDLITSLQAHPFLIVLDGFERELNAYARLDAARNECEGSGSENEENHPSDKKGRFTFDTRIGTLLRSINSSGQSKVLISSRLFPADLEGETELPLPGVLSKEIKGLLENEATDMWHGLGVRGSGPALTRLFRSIGGYPLLVRAMAGEVRRFRKAPGDFEAWQAAHPAFNPYIKPLKQRRTEILEFAMAGIDKVTAQVLETLAAFRMPTSYDLLRTVLAGSGKLCPDESSLITSLEELDERGLVGWDRTKNLYDLHPIVRGVVWTRTTTADRQRINTKIQQEFEAMPLRLESDAKTLSDLFVPIELTRILIEGNHFDKAAEIFYSRLSKPLRRIGAPEVELELLRPLFSGYETLDDDVHSLVNDAYLGLEELPLILAQCLLAINEPRSALKLFQYHNKSCSNLTCRLHQITTFVALGLSNTAERIIMEIIKKVRAAGTDERHRKSEFLCLGFAISCLTSRLEMKTARIALQRAEKLSNSRGFVHDYQARRFLQGMKLDIALSAGRYEDALGICEQKLRDSANEDHAANVFLDLCDRLKIRVQIGAMQDAEADLDAIVNRACELGGMSRLLKSEMAQATLFIKQGRFEEAEYALTDLRNRLSELSSLTLRVAVLTKIGELAGARGQEVQAITAAAEIAELLAKTRDVPRGGPNLEWAIKMLERHQRAVPHFPPPIVWNDSFIKSRFRSRTKLM